MGATTLGPDGAVAASKLDDGPKSIVARGSKVKPLISELIIDLRALMSPHTAQNLKEKKYVKVKSSNPSQYILNLSKFL